MHVPTTAIRDTFLKLSVSNGENFDRGDKGFVVPVGLNEDSDNNWKSLSKLSLVRMVIGFYQRVTAESKFLHMRMYLQRKTQFEF